MPGGQVIYMPQTPTFGQGLGQGVTRGLSNYADMELERQKKGLDMESNMRALNMIKNAGTREKALTIMTTPGLIPFQNMQEFEHARKFIDEVYPQADTTPTLVEGYDAKTGDPLKAYARKGDLLKPDAVVNALGGKDKATLTKPDLEDFYMQSPGDEITHLGRRPRTDQSKGEYTMKELDAMRATQKDKRAGDAADRQAEAAKLAAAAGDRAATASERQGLESTARVLQMAKSQLADIMNVDKTVGKSGEISLNFGGDDKRREDYTKALELMSKELLDAKGAAKSGDTAGAALRAAKAVGRDTTPAQPAPAPAKPKETLGSKVTNFVKGVDSDVAKRFDADPALKEYKLGGGTVTKKVNGKDVTGHPVYDKSGKLVGVYQ